MSQNLTINRYLLDLKQSGRKITMVTAYDYPTAKIVDKTEMDIVLVGDSLANVVLGLDSTRDVGMQEMIHHTKAVRRGLKKCYLVADMPYSSYQIEQADYVTNAKRFMDEAGCDAVKIEWFDLCEHVISQIVKEKIPVIGHIGLTPQTADKLGGYKVQGKQAQAAAEIFHQAQTLANLGCVAIVLECIPSLLAQEITSRVSIPTIGIGAGPMCDGQVLVIHDILGLSSEFRPKFVKKYSTVEQSISKAIQTYVQEVQDNAFPSEEHSYRMDEEEFKKLRTYMSASS